MLTFEETYDALGYADLDPDNDIFPEAIGNIGRERTSRLKAWCCCTVCKSQMIYKFAKPGRKCPVCNSPAVKLMQQVNEYEVELTHKLVRGLIRMDLRKETY